MDYFPSQLVGIALCAKRYGHGHSHYFDALLLLWRRLWRLLLLCWLCSSLCVCWNILKFFSSRSTGVSSY